jgi:hypothetical protein
MITTMKESTVNTEQLQGLVKERNKYRQLLESCLFVFNQLPNKKVGDLRTYDLASSIENSFRRFI